MLSQARGIRGAGIPTKARLTYYQDKSLKLELNYKAENEWTLCFETGAVAIPSVAYLGFSAETGELSDDFDIVSVQTKNLYNASPMDSSKSGGSASLPKGKGNKGYESKQRKEGGGWGWWFVKIVLFCIACGGAYVGFTMYRTSKRHSRFD